MAGSLLNIGTSALTAAQGSLATISHNIANANTPGYSRQEAVLDTAGGQFTGAGFFGRGVDVTTVRRRYDEYLARAASTAISTSEADTARADGLRALDALFANSDNGLGAATDNFFAAAGDLASRPADASARQAFISRASQLATRIDTLGRELVAQQRDADERIAAAATTANEQVDTIKRLNAQIAQSQAAGQVPNDLLDQRDRAVQSLGAQLSVSVVPEKDGTISLFTTSGAPLLVGGQAAKLQAVPDPSDGSRVALNLLVGGQAQPVDMRTLGGGAIAGAVALRDQDLAAALNEVGRFAQVVADAFNRQQAAGVDATGTPGAALFAAPAPVSIPDARNTSTASVGASIANASALQPSDYEVSWNGSAYSVTRLSDRSVSTFAALPATVDGLAFSASAAPAAGDRWVVRPFAAAATGIATTSITAQQVATADPASTAPSADNRNALAFLALAKQPLVNGATLNDAYATLVGNVGLRVQAARDAADVSGALRTEAEGRQQAVSGVNLDEEAADLLRFQQAYQASAKIIQASQSLFEALLAATR